MPVELKVPSVGESISEVFIGQWLKSEGERVEKDEPLVEVETDKATLEVPASVSGTLTKVLKKQGEGATIGEVIAQITEGDAAAPAQESDEKVGEKAGQQAAETSREVDEQTATETRKVKPDAPVEGDAHVMPAAQRLIEEHGLSAKDIQGTGPGGRILKEDVQRQLEQGQKASKPQATPSTPERREAPAQAATQTPAQAPAQAPAGDREEEAVPMSPLRRRIAERLVEAQHNAALLTTFNEIDMSEVMALRKTYQDEFVKRYDLKLGFMSFFVKAVIDALKQIPQLNAEIRGTDIVYKNYYDIGVAVSTERGLLVPVIRNAERLSFAEIEQTIADFGQRARNNKIKPDELQGGTFTISNGGIFGSLMSTPIVNPPQSGVLGMHSIQERPIALNGQVVIRPMMYIALTYDHRIVDGREAVTFLKRIKDAVEKPTRMLLEV
jgi:2-oxoglutarate dehydrogenase E2 component (dihydrolipoamide succinyltransferase)